MTQKSLNAWDKVMAEEEAAEKEEEEVRTAACCLPRLALPRSLPSEDRLLAHSSLACSETVLEWVCGCTVAQAAPLRAARRRVARLSQVVRLRSAVGAVQVLKDLEQLLLEQGRDNMSLEERISQVRQLGDGYEGRLVKIPLVRV